MTYTVIRDKKMFTIIHEVVQANELQRSIDYHSGFKVVEVVSYGLVDSEGVTEAGLVNVTHLYEWLIENNYMEPLF